jgi:hypothetical protein
MARVHPPPVCDILASADGLYYTSSKTHIFMCFRGKKFANTGIGVDRHNLQSPSSWSPAVAISDQKSVGLALGRQLRLLLAGELVPDHPEDPQEPVGAHQLQPRGHRLQAQTGNDI